MHPSQRGWRWCLTALLAVSCTGTPAPAPTPTASSLTGELLTVTSTQASVSLIRYGLSDGSASTQPAPIDPEAVNRSSVVGTSIPDAALFLTAAAGTAQAYRLDAGASEAIPLGPPLPVAEGSEPLLSIEDRAAIVADRGDVWILPLPGAEAWLLAGEGSWAAADPEGLSVVYSPDDRHVFMATVRGGAAPEALFDVAGLQHSLGPGTSPLELVGVPAWGPAGLAFLVRAGDQFAVFVRYPDGRTVEVLQENYANVFRVPRISWQPGGNLLAIADDVGPSGAVLRVFDATTSQLTALSLAPVGFAGTAWAPDGGSIALLTGSGELVVVDLEGDWLAHRETNWRALLAWSADR